MAAVRQWIPLQQQLVPRAKDATSVYSRNVCRRQREAIRQALEKGYLKILSTSLVLEQWEDEGESNLESVLRISLPGSRVQAIDDVTLLSCTRLRVCNLPDCYVSDVEAFYACVNLLKLDLSNNQIERLPRAQFWASLTSLRVLYLHGNTVASRECLTGLNGCPRLHVLTLHSTPLSFVQHYRHHVVNSILSLQALDDYVVSDEEVTENLALPSYSRYKQLSPPFKVNLYLPCSKGTSYQCEMQGIWHLLLAVDRVLARHSPAIVIQRWMRGWKTRRVLGRSSDTRIRSLLKKHPLALKVAPPPPNTAITGLTSRALIHLPPPLPPPAHNLPSGYTLHICPTQSRYIRNSNSEITVKLHTRHIPPPPPSPTSHSPHTLPHSPRPPCYSYPEGSSYPLETHTLVVNPNSMRLCHSIRINLSQLHRNVASHSLSGSVQSQREVRGGKARRERVREGRGKEERGRGGQGGKKQRRLKHETENKPSSEILVHQVKEKDEIMRAKKSVGETKEIIAAALKEERESQHQQWEGEENERPFHVAPSGMNGGIVVSGERAGVILENNRARNMAAARREDGSRVREAERQIKEVVVKSREVYSPKLTSPTTIHGAPRLSKEELAYRRALGTVSLAPLLAMERKHQLNKMRSSLSSKTDHVLYMKQEREERRRKIDEVRRKNRELIENWRASEENKIAKLQEENARKETQQKMNLSLKRNECRENRRRKVEEHEFAVHFTQQNCAIGREQTENDRSLMEEEKAEEMKDQVQLLAEEAEQKRSEAMREREIVVARVTWEGMVDKKQLNTKVVEAAAKRMAEARGKVRKEVVRKDAARATISRAREMLIASARKPQLKEIHPPLLLDLRSELEQVLACQSSLQKGDIRGKSNVQARREERGGRGFRLLPFTREASRSWQRGALEMERREREREGQTRRRESSHIMGGTAACFPFIDEEAEGDTPLIHPPMRPGVITKSLVPTPFQSEVSTSTSSHTPFQSEVTSTPSQNTSPLPHIHEVGPSSIPQDTGPSFIPYETNSGSILQVTGPHSIPPNSSLPVHSHKTIYNVKT